jgi:hypothetical protein
MAAVAEERSLLRFDPSLVQAYYSASLRMKLYYYPLARTGIVFCYDDHYVKRCTFWNTTETGEWIRSEQGSRVINYLLNREKRVLLVNCAPPNFDREDNRLIKYIMDTRKKTVKGGICRSMYPLIEDPRGFKIFCRFSYNNSAGPVLEIIGRVEPSPLVRELCDVQVHPHCNERHPCEIQLRTCACDVCRGRGLQGRCAECGPAVYTKHLCEICYVITMDIMNHFHVAHHLTIPEGSWPSPAMLRAPSPILADPRVLLQMQTAKTAVRRKGKKTTVPEEELPDLHEDDPDVSETHGHQDLHGGP